MNSLEDILLDSLNKIDEINNYMFFLGSYLVKDFKRIDRKSRNGFLIGIYLGTQFEDKKIEDEIDDELKERLRNAKKIADRYVEIIDVDNEKRIITYKNKKDINIEEDTKNIHQGVSRIIMFYNSVLVNLIIEFENYMSNIFMYYIRKYPEAYLSNETIKYTDISSIDDILEIKEMIKRKNVDQIMHENIFHWLKMLREKHKIELKVPNEIKDPFFEAYYRRNLIVHNDLVVNNEYLENIPASLVKPKINEKLRTDSEYIKSIIGNEKKIIIDLLYTIDKKENNEQNILDALTTYAYDCMKEKDWETSTYIYNLVKNDKRINDQERLYSRINYWQSMKRLGKFNEIKNEIEELDVSAYEKIYKFAKEILLEEYKNAIDTLENLYKKEDGITSIELEEWPLFMEFRKTNEYRNFKEKNKVDFLEKNIEPGDEIKSLIQELNNEE